MPIMEIRKEFFEVLEKRMFFSKTYFSKTSVR